MSQREAIIQLHRAGKSNPEIVKLLKAAKSTVRDTVKRFQELGSGEDRPRSGRPRTARTLKNIKAIRERVRRNPKRSMRKMAKEMEINEKVVRTIVKKDLNMSPFKIRRRQQLTDLQKQKRRERAKLLLNRLKRGMDVGEVIFSDEKLFTIEAQFNSQNDRVLGKSAENIPDSVKSVYRRQKPASVMVWAAISETWKSPLIFVKEGAKVNTNSYIEDILTPALVEMKKHFKNESFTFQQDGAPSHTSNKTQQWCRTHFPIFWSKEMWPPSSPDLNPMDFCVWSILEKEACSSPHTNIEALKASLNREWAKIPQDTLRASVKSFRKRLDQVVRAGGGHIEK